MRQRAVVALVDQLARTSDKLSDRIERLMRRRLSRVRGSQWYTAASTDKLARDLAQIARDGQDAQAGLTAAYFDRVFAELDIPPKPRAVTELDPLFDDWPEPDTLGEGIDLEPVDDDGEILDESVDLTDEFYADLDRDAGGVIDVELPDAIRGAEPDDVWQRPANQYRYDISRGIDEAEAADRAIERAVTMADDERQLADREAARQKMAANGLVIGYRRIIHPELSAGGSCGLCIAASGRLYGKTEPKPIHERCKCSILPVTSEEDPGARLNETDLEALYQQADGNTAAKLKRTRYQVVQHGELGPILRLVGQQVRDRDEALDNTGRGRAVADADPSALPKRRSNGKVVRPAAEPADITPARAQAILDGAGKALADLQARARAGENLMAPIAYQRGLIRRMSRIVRAG